MRKHKKTCGVGGGGTAAGGRRRAECGSPCTLHPTPYTLHPAPCTLNPTPYTLHPTPYALHPTPYTLHPAPYTSHLTPYTLHPTPHTLHPTPYTVGSTPRSARKVHHLQKKVTGSVTPTASGSGHPSTTQVRSPAGPCWAATHKQDHPIRGRQSLVTTDGLQRESSSSTTCWSEFTARHALKCSLGVGPNLRAVFSLGCRVCYATFLERSVCGTLQNLGRFCTGHIWFSRILSLL